MPALITNGSSTGSSVTWGGGTGVFAAVGTWSGATVTMQFLGPDGATWVEVGGNTTLTANGAGVFVLPPGQIRALVTGSPTGIYATANKVQS